MGRLQRCQAMADLLEAGIEIAAPARDVVVERFRRLMEAC